jgi:hypothetical protein
VLAFLDEVGELMGSAAEGVFGAEEPENVFALAESGFLEVFHEEIEADLSLVPEEQGGVVGGVAGHESLLGDGMVASPATPGESQ